MALLSLLLLLLSSSLGGPTVVVVVVVGYRVTCFLQIGIIRAKIRQEKLQKLADFPNPQIKKS